MLFSTFRWVFLASFSLAGGRLSRGLVTVASAEPRHVFSAQRNARSASTPSVLRPPCSRPHFSIIGRLVPSADAGSIAISAVFVGMMANIV